MWTIAGGIILAIILIIALPHLVVIISVIVALIIGIGLIVGAVILFINEPEIASTILAIVVFLFVSILIHSVYTSSRNIKLFFSELVLLFSPALSIRAKAEKEARLEIHQQLVKDHNTTQKNIIINKIVLTITKIIEKLWKKYKQHGDIQIIQSNTTLSCKLTDDTQLFDVKIVLDYPNCVDPTFIYNTNDSYTEKSYDYPSKLKRPMRKKIRAVVLEKERKLVRESITKE